MSYELKIFQKTTLTNSQFYFDQQP